mmetsp:Transcript_6928/g.16990  ORF Transcript_6928/g.16990 Transcript_6928/m.16990 type:complete len:223 (+) Transcript_6928:557-1225(+)
MSLGPQQQGEDVLARLKRCTGMAADAIAAIPAGIPVSETFGALQQLEFHTNLIKDARDEITVLKAKSAGADGDGETELKAEEAKVVPKVHKYVQTAYAIARRLCVFTQHLAENPRELKAGARESFFARLERHVTACSMVSEEIDEMCSSVYAPQDMKSVRDHAKELHKHLEILITDLRSDSRFNELPPAKDGKSAAEWLNFAMKAARTFLVRITTENESIPA